MEIFILVAVVLGIYALTTYKVVPPNEVHVVVFMGSGKKVYSSKDGHTSSYFFMPFLMKRYILPMANVKMAITDIHLNDKDVAPFECDVICWIHIEDAARAAERLDLEHDTDIFASLRDSLINIVQSVARSVSMQHGLLDIMRDRVTFANSVYGQVNGALDTWGVAIVNLEVNDIRDDANKGSTIIADHETMIRAEVKSLTRQQVAIRDNEAVMVEQESKKKSEVARAEAEELLTKRQIEKDKAVGISQAEKDKDIAKATEEANEQKVAAFRRLEVGKATVTKEAAIETATGEAEALRIKGEKEANVTMLKGQAESSAIENKGLAEAKAKDAMATALKSFNESGIGLEKIRAVVEIQKSKYASMAEALSKADLKLVSSGKGGSIFGFDLNAETGADLAQMVESLGVDKVKELVK